MRMVADVARFELMKTRLLNASHVVLGFLGQVAGLRTTAEAVADPAVHDYLSALMSTEVVPLLPEPDGIDLADYQATLLQRFANPAISDQLSRLCRRGSQKMPDFVLPSLHQALAEGRPHALLTLAVAGWARALQGTDEAGRPLELQDARAERLQELARAGGTDPRPLLAERELFGDLADDEAFAARLQSTLEQLHRDGVRATLAAYVAAEPAPPARTDDAEQLPA